jgi:fermentation-respiration switch protein FrsA (DUF1100 family)
MRKLRRFFFSALKGTVIVYAMVVGILWFMQDTMLYHRSAGAPMLNDPMLLPKREIVCLTTADGLNLRSWYFKPARADLPTVVFFHGNAGDIGNHLPFAKFLIEAGYGLLALEYRGYGGNPGTPREAGLIADGRAALAFLNVQGVPDSGIVLYGESLGTGIAVQLAAEHQVRALILRSPYTSIAEVAAIQLPYIPARWLVRDRFDSLAKIRLSKAPLFIFHGANDALIPIALGRQLFEAAPEPKTWLTIESVGHNDVQTPEAEHAMLDFLAQLPPDAPSLVTEVAPPPIAACGT